MKQQPPVRFPIGIVLRLRIVLILICAIFIASSTFAIRKMQYIDRAVASLADTTLNYFVVAQHIESMLQSHVRDLRHVADVNDREELDSLRAQLQLGLQQLRDETAILFSTGRAADLMHRLSVALDTLDSGTKAIIAAKEAEFTYRESVFDLVASLRLSHTNIRHILEALSYDFGLPTAAASTLPPAPETALRTQESFIQGLTDANTVTALTLLSEAVIDEVANFQSLPEATVVASKEQNLRFKFRSIVLLLQRLKPGQLRTELAKEVMSMREKVFASEGLFILISDWHAREIDIDRLMVPLLDIKILSAEMTQSARERLQAAQLGLKDTTKQLMIIFVATALAVLLILAATAIFLVERQINSRIRKLTKAVLAIAEGQEDVTVDVNGQDELGKMARALDVFKDNAQELRRSNSDLEKFAYAAAHDLRSPLRAIQDLLDWTLDDPDNSFSEEGARNMELLHRRAGRLNQLLSDLLAYSRVGREADHLADLSTHDVVFELAEMLDPDKHFKIEINGPDLHICTFSTPLRQILLNLLNNAMKHHDRSTGRITITPQLSGGRITISISDDGPGINSKYHDRIFGLFQTLRTRDEVEGSGIGLAIIRKLVEHYGGSIAVFSDPDTARGTEFVFDLPVEKRSVDPVKRAA